MERKISKKLLAWKNRKDRKPLILYGARQVGKTYIINDFGRRHFKDVIYVNFEINIAIARDFDDDISPNRIINLLEIFFNQKISKEDTLIIFDEIQACERALTSLKYFCEISPEYHLIAAGSLLGVAVNREKYSFPVGKVDMLTLYPFDFEEYLWAMSHQALAQEIRECFDKDAPLSQALHELAIQNYKEFLVVGGMPAVVKDYVTEGRLINIRNVQELILNSYIADMAKYASATETSKILATFHSIPTQLAKENKKFQFKIIRRGGSVSIFGPAIDWLAMSSIVLKCHKIEHAMMPPAVYQDFSSFKLYMHDVGLLTCKAGLPIHSIVSETSFDNTFIGAIAENYVATHLHTNGYELYYWTSQHLAEIDFVIQRHDQLIPIEVKAGAGKRSRSLTVYREKYVPTQAIKISMKNFGRDGEVKSVPLYAAFCIE